MGGSFVGIGVLDGPFQMCFIVHADDNNALSHG